MYRLIGFILCLLLSLQTTVAQKKEISQARSYIKSGKNLDKAEKLLLDLLDADSLNQENPRIFVLLYQVVRKQYDAGNETLYLRQKYDTASLFNLTKRMFEICEHLDSLGARPDRKGRTHLDYRKRHAEELNAIRLNLYLGGRFFLARGQYPAAFTFFDSYIDCAQQPLFESYSYLQTDTLMPHAAYWATYAALRYNQPELVLKHAELALADSLRAPYTLQYKAEAYRMQQNDSLYVKTLAEGFSRFADHVYFYSHLMDAYNASEMYADALQLSEQALQQYPDHELFLFGKSTVLLNMGRHVESLAISQHLIELNDSLPEPYFNAATAILNQILPLERNRKANRQQLQALYQQACPYMERYRLLAPDQKAKWAPALYKIYLNLNMGRQFDEIDRLLREQ